MFDALIAPEPDDLMAVAKRVRDDGRADRLDLGVGVYRDAAGRTPVLSVVRQAAEMLLGAETTKTYLSPAGDPVFVDLLTRHVLSPALHVRLSDQVAGVQAPGGTGALRLGAELAMTPGAGATLWGGLPTCPNPRPGAAAAGLRCATYEAIDLSNQRLDFDRVMTALRVAAPGDLVLLQGCCHNPTGIDFTPDEWQALAGLLEERALVPLIDFAYQGLGIGIEDDAHGVRLLLDRLPEAIVAVSCSKSFSLYSERVGLLIVKARTGRAAAAASATLQAKVRPLYSNPPAPRAPRVRPLRGRPPQRAEGRRSGPHRARTTRPRRRVARRPRRQA